MLYMTWQASNFAVKLKLQRADIEKQEIINNLKVVQRWSKGKSADRFNRWFHNT